GGRARGRRHAVADLGGDAAPLAGAGERASEALLGGAVAARGVDEVHAEVEGAADETVDVGVTDFGPADAPGSEADRGDKDTRRPERAEVHGRHRTPSPSPSPKPSPSPLCANVTETADLTELRTHA